MRHLTKITALLLAVIMLLCGCGSNTNKYAGKTAAVYGKETVELDEANFWLRFYQWMYDSYYGSMYLYLYQQDFWTISADGIRSNAESMKEEVMAAFRQCFILKDYAKANGIDYALTAEEQQKVKEFVAGLHENYADEFFTLLGNPDDSKIEAWVTSREEAIKVWDSICSKADISGVKEEDYESFTMSYIIVPKADEAKEGTETMAGEELAKFILKGLTEEGKSFETVKTEHSELANSTLSFVRANEEAAKDTNGKLAPSYEYGKDMKTGEAKYVQVEAGDWYVLYCNSDSDAAASANKKAELENEIKAEFFNGYLKDMPAQEFKVKNCYNVLTLAYSYVEKPAETTAAAN